MALPPYQPDGSFPLPSQELTAKDLVDRYGVSKQTLYTRISTIGVSGSKRGKQEGLSAISLEIQYVGSNPKPVSETEGKLRARVASISMPSSSNLQPLNSTIVRF